MKRIALLFFLTMVLSADGHAQHGPSPQELDAIGHAAEILRQQGQGNPLVRGLADQAEGLAQQQLEQNRPLALPAQDQLILFVSASMGEEGLKRAFLAASQQPSMTIVFRGALQGEKLSQLVQRLAGLLDGIEPKPNIAIHPKSFREHSVRLVPTIIQPATGKSVRGTVSARVFEDKASKRRATDLGTVGPVSKIIEPDLVDQIKRRMAKVDVEQRAEEAVASYWRRAPFIDVPKAKKRRTRYLDPTVVTDNDLRDHEGRLLAPAGTEINPLAALPFTSRLIIFDGTDPDERAWARERVRDDRKTILITTRIDRGVGWPAWKTLHQNLGRPVYLLQADVAERFALAATPTLIEAAPDGKTLMIIEDVPSQAEGRS